MKCGKSAFAGVLTAALSIYASACDMNNAVEPARESATASLALENSTAERVARSIALSLADKTTRVDVVNAMKDSPIRESKLEFRWYLRNRGSALLRQMAAKDMSAEGSLLAAVDSIIPMEFYMPVQSHRRNWNAESEMMVAVQLNENDAPVAFDSKGDRHVLSNAAPPATPTLVLVPVETNFAVRAVSSIGHMVCDFETCTGGGSGGTGSPPRSPAGLYAAYSYISDLREPWTRGSPEIEFDLVAPGSSLSDVKVYSCAHEDAAGYARFDQDQNEWFGALNGQNDALIADSATIEAVRGAYPSGSTDDQQGMLVVVTEDDSDRCVMNDDDDEYRTNVQYAFVWGTLTLTNVLLHDWTNPHTEQQWSAFLAAAGVYYIQHYIRAALGDDDLIGAAELTSVWNAHHNDNAVRTHVIARNGVRVGEMNLHLRPSGYYAQ